MKEYTPDFSPEGDMVYINQSLITSDIQIMNVEKRVRGIFHPETYRTIGFAIEHETLEDLYSTLGLHEPLHGLIQEEKDEDPNLKIDEDQEHWVIRQMAWAPESLVD